MNVTYGRLTSRVRTSAELAVEQRDVTLSSTPVAGVGLIGGDDPRPQFIFLRPVGDSCMHGATLTMDGEFDVGMGEQVHEPIRIAVVTPLGGHQHDHVIADNRCGEQDRSLPSRGATDRVQLHDQHPKGRRADARTRRAQHAMVKEVERPESTVDEVTTPPAHQENLVQAVRRIPSSAPRSTTKGTRDGEESTRVA